MVKTMAKGKDLQPTDSFLREAIAEAKQVKETAMANAKLAIEDAFRPHLANKWSKQLRNEMIDADNDGHGKSEGGETDTDAVMETTTLDSSEIGTGDNKDPDSDARSTSKIDNPGQEVDTMGEGAEVDSDGHTEVLNQLTEDDEEEFDLDADGDEEDLGGDRFAGDEFGGDEFGGGEDEFGGGEDEFGSPEGEFGMDDDEDDDSLDLEALVRELENDVQGYDDMGEDISQAAKRAPGTQTVDMEPALAPEGDGQDVLRLRGESVDEELDEILREMEESDDDDEDDEDVVEEMRSQVVELKHKLREHRDVISFLKSRLTEINMLNAKLLYTNKLFKEYSLNSGDKMRIYETFDRVTTVREAKLLFTTLAEVYKGTSSKSRRPSKRVVESIASMPVGSTKPKSVLKESTSAETREANNFKHRMQILSGILEQE